MHRMQVIVHFSFFLYPKDGAGKSSFYIINLIYLPLLEDLYLAYTLSPPYVVAFRMCALGHSYLQSLYSRVSS